MRHLRRIVPALLCAGLLFTAAAFADEPDSKQAAKFDVVAFSPYSSPLDGIGGIARTDSRLRASADLRYAGQIVIAFRDGLRVDPSTIYLNGDPRLGLDPSALQVVREVDGVGSVAVPVKARVQGSRVVLQPLPPFAKRQQTDSGERLVTSMPDGQYTVGVFAGVKDTRGSVLRNAPVFHTFVVGTPKPTAPRVLTTSPVEGASGVPAGVRSGDIVVRFNKPIDGASVGPESVVVRDRGSYVPAGATRPRLVPALGYPRVRPGSGGHEVIWRNEPNHGGFPYGTTIEVTVHGAETGESALRDADGMAMETTHRLTFQTKGPPNLIWWEQVSDEIRELKKEIEALKKELRELRERK